MIQYIHIILYLCYTVLYCIYIFGILQKEFFIIIISYTHIFVLSLLVNLYRIASFSKPFSEW